MKGRALYAVCHRRGGTVHLAWKRSGQWSGRTLCGRWWSHAVQGQDVECRVCRAIARRGKT